MDRISGISDDPVINVTVTTEETTTSASADAAPQVAAMEVDFAPVNHAQVQSGPETEPMVVEETRFKTAITAALPQETPRIDVFSLPAEPTPSEPSFRRQALSGVSEPHPTPQQSYPSSLLGNGEVPSTSRRSPIPETTTFVGPGRAATVQPEIAATSIAVDVVPRQRSSSPARMVRTGYIYDPLMMLHCQDGYTPTADNVVDAGDGHPEEPMRIKRIFARLAESGLIKRMKKLEFSQVSFDQVLLVHTEDHWNKVQGTESAACEISPRFADILAISIER